MGFGLLRAFRVYGVLALASLYVSWANEFQPFVSSAPTESPNLARP